ncbi:hypothetical protein R1flu_014446 [Riccia fluitans]|uniref:MADF domain-containing protein n=1 Tax=Riccia fluitans TaxID=41844 RepID=A0ABD1YGH0_9MARC
MDAFEVTEFSEVPEKEVARWDDDSTHALLCAFRDKYLFLRKGNLSSKRWVEVTDVIKATCSWRVDWRQAKGKIENMKKKYSASDPGSATILESIFGNEEEVVEEDVSDTFP